MFVVGILSMALLSAHAARAHSGSPATASTPNTPYGPDWQSYFQVSGSLPGISFTLPTSYAGSLSVNRSGHDSNSLFFWGFEHQAGSLSAGAGQNSDAPWAIWLNGGPGSSSMNGLFNENGPIQVQPGQQLASNPYAWNQLADYFWLDQPVGVGFSVADSNSFAADEVQVAQDFVNFLTNLVTVFPSLATRPFYLTGESYAGRYITYITKQLFAMDKAPVKLAKIAIGDPALGTSDEFKTMPALQTIATHPAIIGYDVDVYNYFAEQTHLCGLDINLTYPQGGPIPPVKVMPGNPHRKSPTAGNNDEGTSHPSTQHVARRGAVAEIAARAATRGLQTRKKGQSDNSSPTGLADRLSGSIDPWYGCELFDEMVDYAVNYTWPWTDAQEFDTFNVPDAVNPEASTSPNFFLTNSAVASALHAPANKQWTLSIDYPWGGSSSGGDPSPEPMTFLTQLATDAASHGVSFAWFVGNDDALSPHFGTEVSIQNTTFGGTQGFTQQPSTPWYDDQGEFAGIVHQERNWTYGVLYGAGHQVAIQQPAAAYVFARNFIFGSNTTGLIAGTNKAAQAQEGGATTNPTLQQTVLPAAPGVAYGSRTTAGVTSAPAASVSAFYAAIGVQPLTGTTNILGITPTTAIAPTATAGSSKHHSGVRSAHAVPALGVLALLVAGILVW